MKRVSGNMVVLTAIALFSGCAYKRIGDLTMISTRNIDSRTDYQLIQKYAVGKARSKNGHALEAAIDKAVRLSPDGEFLKNVRVYVKNDGKKVKVEGDIWGVPSIEKNVTISVAEAIEFSSGDKVSFRNTMGKIVEGTIVGLNKHTAIVEYTNAVNKEAKTEIKYEKLTRLQK